VWFDLESKLVAGICGLAFIELQALPCFASKESAKAQYSNEHKNYEFATADSQNENGFREKFPEAARF
jgi:hypothetical protein